MTRGAAPSWRDEEIEFLLGCNDWSAQRLAAALGRTERAVTNIRYKLRQGWRPDQPQQSVDRKNQRRWTDEELGLVNDMGLSPAYIAEIIDRSAKAVRHMRARLRSGWEPVQPEPWTPDEDSVLMSLPHLTVAQQARRLSRSKDAILHRRQILSETKGVVFDRSNRSPFRPGGRTLVAKSCKTCGQLLSSYWFAPERAGGRRQWRASCKRCDPAHLRSPNSPARVAARSAGKSDSSRQSGRALQTMSMKTAKKRGEPYTDKDHAIMADPDLTLLEKAVATERTYFSATFFCSKNGYRSRVGIGSPTDAWTVENPHAARLAV